MKRASLIAAAMTLGLAQAASAQDVVGDAAVQNQWFTGTLEAPSPALPAAGILEVEPYVIWTRSHGAYDDGGSFHSSPNIDVLTSVTALKYSLTNRISIQALPSISHVSTSPGHYTGFGDLPVEAEYRLSDANNRTGLPSVTIAIGVTLPTGKYDRMRTALSGFGSGAYSLKQQILLQSLFDTRGGHPMRFRTYVAVYEPIGKSSVTDISTYGTSEGFHGEAQPRFSATLGVGGGYAFDRRWVFAMDLVHKYADGFTLDGKYAGNVLIHSRSGRRTTTSLAPALEYNISGNVGIIAGVDFSVAGHNSAAYFAPQIAISVGL
jgi:hypothetical protein